MSTTWRSCSWRAFSWPLEITALRGRLVVSGRPGYRGGARLARSMRRSSAPTRTWGSAASIDGTKVINSVSCASSTFCVAVDANGNAVKYTGTWGSAASIDGTTSIASVSCPSSTFCEAVDASGNALKYNGSTWSSSVIDRHQVLEAVSCQSSTFCEAVDNAGNVLTYNGSSKWSSSNVDSTRTMKSVSCPTATFCAAVDANGNVLTYNGTSWSSATDIDGTTAMNGISCTSSTFCQIIDASGNNLTYNGSAWSYAVSIDGTTALEAISCPTSTSCQAEDGAGKAIPYGPMNITSQLTWDTNGSLARVLSDSGYDYLYGPTGEPVEQVSVTPIPASPNPVFMTYTPSDSSWLLTNATGNPTAFYSYDAYGNLAYGTPASPFGYSGQYTDPATGLINDRARWYEPQTGGFTTFDPAFTQTDSAYTYAGGDPIDKSDPSGLFTVCFAVWCSSRPNQPAAPPTSPQSQVKVHVPGIGTTTLSIDSEFKYALDSAIYGSLPVWEVLVAEESVINPSQDLIAGLDDTLNTNTTDCSSCDANSPDYFAAAVILYDKVLSSQYAFEFYLQQGNSDLAYFDYKTTGLEQLSRLYSSAVSFGQGAEDIGASGKFRVTQIFHLWGLVGLTAGQAASDIAYTSGECAPAGIA